MCSAPACASFPTGVEAPIPHQCSYNTSISCACTPRARLHTVGDSLPVEYGWRVSQCQITNASVLLFFSDQAYSRISLFMKTNSTPTSPHCQSKGKGKAKTPSNVCLCYENARTRLLWASVTIPRPTSGRLRPTGDMPFVFRKTTTWISLRVFAMENG